MRRLRNIGGVTALASAAALVLWGGAAAQAAPGSDVLAFYQVPVLSEGYPVNPQGLNDWLSVPGPNRSPRGYSDCAVD